MICISVPSHNKINGTKLDLLTTRALRTELRSQHLESWVGQQRVENHGPWENKNKQDEPNNHHVFFFLASTYWEV
jgi:hypothetical protein